MALRRFIILTVFLMMLAAAPIWGNTGTIPDLPRISDPVRIDGILDDDAWRQALQIQVDSETKPGENIPAKVKTVTYLMRDGDSVFAAFDARGSEPSAVRAFLRDRDSACNDDEVGAHSHVIGRQLLYSHRLIPQTVFFLGYCDRHVDDDDLDSLAVADRTFFMKIGYAWTP